MFITKECLWLKKLSVLPPSLAAYMLLKTHRFWPLVRKQLNQYLISWSELLQREEELVFGELVLNL